MKDHTPKFEEFQVGDAIRAYDFDGRLDCYVEGVIEEVVTQENLNALGPQFAHYRILCDVDVWDGANVTTGDRLGTFVFVPMQVPWDWDGRIVLSPDDEILDDSVYMRVHTDELPDHDHYESPDQDYYEGSDY